MLLTNELWKPYMHSTPVAPTNSAKLSGVVREGMRIVLEPSLSILPPLVSTLDDPAIADFLDFVEPAVVDEIVTAGVLSP